MMAGLIISLRRVLEDHGQLQTWSHVLLLATTQQNKHLHDTTQRTGLYKEGPSNLSSQRLLGNACKFLAASQSITDKYIDMISPEGRVVEPGRRCTHRVAVGSDGRPYPHGAWAAVLQLVGVPLLLAAVVHQFNSLLGELHLTR